MLRSLLSLALSGWMLAQSPGTFSPTGNMSTPRFSHSATLLQNGKVLIAGGGSDTLELYDPSNGTFQAIGSKTASKNVGAATLLADGRVLLIEASETQDDPILWTFFDTQTAELYDPSTGMVTATGSLIEGQSGYVATLLANGKVLVTGGMHGLSDGSAQAATAELYDPLTQTFSLAGPYADTGAPSLSDTYGAGTSGLTFVPASLLADGRVLIASESAAELYDPALNAFRVTGSMGSIFGFSPTSFVGRTSTLLGEGEVLVAGGVPVDYDTGVGIVGEAELYRPLTGAFTATGSLINARYSHEATLLPNGYVLITGGFGSAGDKAVSAAEIYRPDMGVFQSAGDLGSPRVGHRATLLADGRVLITGGRIGENSQALASAEIFTPTAAAPPPVLLSLPGGAAGQGAVQHANGYQTVSPENPASAGEIILIYCTGLTDGRVIPPQVAIGGMPAEVLWFGNVPAFSGLNQMNVRVPDGIPSGPAIPVRFTYLSRPSNAVTIGVR